MAEEEERTLRQTVESAADKVLSSAPSAISDPKPGENSTHSDRADLGLCDLLALMFALPFGEDLYHGNPITDTNIAYLVVGLMLAAFGHIWPRVKASLPSRWTHTVAQASLDFRVWLGVLLIIFLISVGPQVYQRAIAPGTMPTAEDIAKAVVRELPASRITPPPASSPPSSADEQTIADLRGQLTAMQSQRDGLQAQLAQASATTLNTGVGQRMLTSLEMERRLIKAFRNYGNKSIVFSFTAPGDNEEYKNAVSRAMRQPRLAR